MTKQEHTASASGINLDISKKHAVEIGRFVRYRPLEKVKTLLGEVIIKKSAVPFTKFKRDVGHKRGMAAGRYPVKAATRILALVKSAESNAEDKGLDIDALYLTAFITNKGNGAMHQGRKGGREMKRTNIYVALEEKEEKKKVVKKKIKKKVQETKKVEEIKEKVQETKKVEEIKEKVQEEIKK